MKAELRVCASCEWIFKGNSSCPQCGFMSYSAHYVYGRKAYRYAQTQEPWMEKKIQRYRASLLETIEEARRKECTRKTVRAI